MIKLMLLRHFTLPQYDLLNVDNPYFEQMVSQINPTDLQLNKTIPLILKPPFGTWTSPQRIV